MPNINQQKLLKENENLKNEIRQLKSRKKYGLVWDSEKEPEKVVELCKEKLPILTEESGKEIKTGNDKPVNVLIEGDNYHALSVLNYTHQGKIDVIYIDPPYNTGAKNWKYNNRFVEKDDAYRHSKWLNMMARRLILAKNLLKKNGCLVCAIDENEHANLSLLLKQIFVGRTVDSVTVVHNPRGVQGKNFSYNHEYAVFCYPNTREKYISNAQRDEALVRNFRVDGSNSPRNTAKTCFYPFIISKDKIIGIGEVAKESFHPKKQTIEIKNGVFEVWPIDVRGVERKWPFSRNTVEAILEELYIKKGSRGFEVYRSKNESPYRTVWVGAKYDANEYGSKLVNGLTGVQFPFPKSLYTVKECLLATTKYKKDAVILDFFAGSGTTGHAVSLLNKEDGGSRKFILCTNNEGGIAQEVCYPRVKAVINGSKKYPEITGIPSNLKYFKTDFVDGGATDKNKKNLVNKSTEMLCLKENCFEEIARGKHFKMFKGNGEKYLGIVYDDGGIHQFKKEVKKLGKNFVVYVFSLDESAREEEFEDINDFVELKPIPAVILNVYKRIFK